MKKHRKLSLNVDKMRELSPAHMDLVIGGAVSPTGGGGGGGGGTVPHHTDGCSGNTCICPLTPACTLSIVACPGG